MEVKMFYTRLNPKVIAVMDKVADEYSSDGIRTLFKQDHIAYAIMHYAKTLREKGVKNGINIRKELNI